jgi:hypothetical protein
MQRASKELAHVITELFSVFQKDSVPGSVSHTAVYHNTYSDCFQRSHKVNSMVNTDQPIRDLMQQQERRSIFRYAGQWQWRQTT